MLTVVLLGARKLWKTFKQTIKVCAFQSLLSIASPGTCIVYIILNGHEKLSYNYTLVTSSILQSVTPTRWNCLMWTCLSSVLV